MRPLTPGDTAGAVRLWNAAFAAEFHVDPEVWDYCTWETPGFFGEDARLAEVNGEPVGVVVAKTWRLAPLGSFDRTVGCISALAVHPSRQDRGIGEELLAWAEARLAGQGARTLVLGRDINPFFPGVPVATGSAGFFMARGYVMTTTVYHVTRDLVNYTPHPAVVATRERLGQRLEVGAATNADREELAEFLRQEFPGRWAFQVQRHVSGRATLADVVIARLDGAIHGFAMLHSPSVPYLTFARGRPHSLPQPEGGLGPIGVSGAVRGQGLGLVTLDAGLQLLRDRGTRGCLIDWTTLVDFYRKVGFEPTQAFRQAEKRL